MPRVLVYEGGKCQDAHDPGGRTNQGVTQGTYNMYRRSKGLAVRDVWLMDAAERDEIYTVHYWAPVHGDELPTGLSFAVFDAAVNSGVGQAGKWLQRALGSHYQGANDGIVGGKTLQAVLDFCQSEEDVEDLIIGFSSRRLATLQSLKTWRYFGKGWGARIANCQKVACAWAKQAEAGASVDVTSAGGHRKALIADIKPAPISEIATHATTAVSAAGAFASQTAEQLRPLSDTWEWIKWGCAALMLAGIIAGVAVKLVSSIRDAAVKGDGEAHVDLDADADFPIVMAA
jgi:lysozyme family protein